MSKKANGEINSIISKIATTEEFQQFFESNKKSVIIMFADMVGSTAYKHNHSIFDGLRKVIRHNNDVIARIAAEHKGRIVKYIGDEVMVHFEPSEGEDAINTAIEIQERFNNINRDERRGGAEKIESQIGIGYGDDALLLDNGDIHGTPVDVAKRLVAIAKPTQILINEDLRANIRAAKITSEILGYEKSMKPEDLISEKPEKRKVKGIQQEIEIYEVRWGREFLGVKDKDRLASEWKRVHQYLTNIFLCLDRLGGNLNNITEFKDEWRGLKELDDHPYKRLVKFFYNSTELQYDEIGKDEDETGKKKMESLEEAYGKVDEELKRTGPSTLQEAFTTFSIAITNFLSLADRSLKERFDIEEDK